MNDSNDEGDGIDGALAALNSENRMQQRRVSTIVKPRQSLTTAAVAAKNLTTAIAVAKDPPVASVLQTQFTRIAEEAEYREQTTMMSQSDTGMYHPDRPTIDYSDTDTDSSLSSNEEEI